MNSFKTRAFAAYNTEEETRKNSSSGGLFSAFAEFLINCGGIVYGVKMSDDCYSSEYARIVDLKDIYKIRGSKYLQARIGDTFCRVKKDLDDGLSVLFSGTGCYVSGLKSYLGKEYANLYCIDVVCHGVPSQLLWKKYVDSLESRYGKLKRINFRCKDKGREEFGIKNNYLYFSRRKDSFFRFFLRDYSLRPSCYECNAKTNKQSDISLADFWGINQVLPEMNDNKGISLVLVRTEKGNMLFSECIQSINSMEVDYSKAVNYNPAESHSAKRPVHRDYFYSDLNKLEYKDLVRKYIPVTFREVIGDIKFVCKKIVKQILNFRKRKRDNSKVLFDTNSDYGILFTFEGKAHK